MEECGVAYNLVAFPPCPQKAITLAEGYRIMTNTHDGSHTWLKYLSRKEKLWDQIMKDFIKEQDRGRKFYKKPNWTKEQVDDLSQN